MTPTTDALDPAWEALYAALGDDAAEDRGLPHWHHATGGTTPDPRENDKDGVFIERRAARNAIRNHRPLIEAALAARRGVPAMTPTPDPLREALRDMVAHDSEQRDCCGDWGTDPCPHRTRAEAALAQPAPTLDVRPEIVCLCGSTRFYDMFQAANYDLTMLGKIVLSVGFYPHSKAMHGHGEGVGHDSVEKVALDELHKRKIDLADRVYVLNVNGYIGSSTRSEIEYAIAHGKPVDYLEGPA